MILAQLGLLCLLALGVFAAVVVNPITGITSKNLMFTGTIDSGNSKLFYTFYGKDGEMDQGKLSSNSLIIAMGSPGRSAQYINLGGLGPKTLRSNMTLADNLFSLTENSNVMFLDSLASGFSFVASSDSIPTEAKSFGVAMTAAINSFVD